MSQYNFYDLIANCDEIESLDGEDPASEYYSDIVGRHFCSWANDVILGWDDGLETYFISACDSDSDSGPVWWFGNTPKEINSPMALIAILDRVFNKHPHGKCFTYSTDLIGALIAERDAYVQGNYSGTGKEELASFYTRLDERWRDASSDAVPFSYLLGHIRSDYADVLSRGARNSENSVRATEVTDEDWFAAPRCPAGIRDPIVFGRDLYAKLKGWANDRKFQSGSLRFWDARSCDSKPYPEQEAAWQIAWEDGPKDWAIILLHGLSYEHNRLDVEDGRTYFLEPATRMILGMAWF